MTEAGRKRVAEREAAAKGIGRWDSAESNQLDDRCLIMAGAGPPMMDAAYNSNYHIVQAPGYVMILAEMIHDVRVIPLDARPAPSDRVRQWMGTSRGHWEGDTLVVETSNFNGKNPFGNSSARMRVTERFRRVSDQVILYRFTIDDGTTWTRPWTGEMPMQKTTGPLFEHACHEGNFGLYAYVGRGPARRAARRRSGPHTSKGAPCGCGLEPGYGQRRSPLLPRWCRCQRFTQQPAARAAYRAPRARTATPT